MSSGDTHGQPTAREILEWGLKVADTEQVRYALVVLAGQNVAKCDMAGSVAFEKAVLDGLEKQVIPRLKANIESLRLPPSNPVLGADYVCYDLASGPLSFDFVHWLIDAEMTRIREQAPAPLKVGFWMGHQRPDIANEPLRQQWLNKVFRPCLTLINAAEDENAVRGRQKDLYGLRDVVGAYRSGEKLPRLSARTRWDGPKGAVTITLREKEDWDYRNSPVMTWVKFAEWLEGRGEKVLIVRDTAKAAEPLSPWLQTVPEASTNLLTRIALYESAKMNLFSANGPIALCTMGYGPWMVFIPPKEAGDADFYNTDAGWRRLQGIGFNEQLPWAQFDRRYIWAKPTLALLKTEWARFQGEL